MDTGTVQNAMPLETYRREAWLQKRMSSVGSSDSPAIVGLSRWKTPLHIYLEKTGELQPQRPNQAQKSGLLLENVVAAMYEEQTGNVVQMPDCPHYTSPTKSFMAATLDRTTKVDGEWGILELKTARTAEGWGVEGSEDIPPDYYCQVQHQMYVTGYRFAMVAALIAGQDLKVYRIRYDDDYAHRLMVAIDYFWNMVQTKNPPPFDWEHPATPDLVRRSQKIVAGKVVQDDSKELHDLCRAYCHVKDMAKSIDEEKGDIHWKLLLKVGEAETVTTSSGYVVKRRKITRKAYHAEESQYINLTVKEPKNGE